MDQACLSHELLLWNKSFHIPNRISDQWSPLVALSGFSYWKATRLQALIEGGSILKYFCFSAGWLWTTIKLPSPMIDAANGFDPVLYLKILTHNSVFLAKPDGRWAGVDTRTIFDHFRPVPSQVSQVILPLINSCYCLCICDCLCNCRSICLIVSLVRWSLLIILKKYWKVYNSLGCYSFVLWGQNSLSDQKPRF